MPPEMLLLLGAPLAGGALLAFVGHRRRAAELNIAFSVLTFAGAAALVTRVIGEGPVSALQEQLFVDSLNVFLVALTAFVAMTTSIFSRPYMRIERDHGRVSDAGMRLFHAMYQLFGFTMLLVLTTNNLGVMWVAMEAATLTTVLLVALYRTHAALEAAWKYFILCGVGIAQALFGTILVYFAAERILGAGVGALLWTHLDAVKGELEPAVVSIAFVFLLVGYGTKVGLVPLHAWLPDAHAEGPTPISAVLSGLLLNVALFAVLRFKSIMSSNPAALAPGPLMVTLGLASVVFAAFMLYRRQDIKRLFAYSSIEHMGIITFAFGMGGTLANFAGLLHMALHSLTKSAIFFCVGHVAQVKGTQRMADIRGLTVSHPILGWSLGLGVVAIAGLPPMGLFMTEFLIITSTFARAPLLAIILGLALLVGLGALLLRLNGLAFGDPDGRSDPDKASFLPIGLHLAIVLAAGIWLPPSLVAWFQYVASLLN